MNSVAVKDLGKTYSDGTQALKTVDFEVKSGEGVVLLGHNGSGKSTLFKCITGFEQPSAGSIHVNGQLIDISDKPSLKETRKDIGMVFQHFNLIENVSVFQNVLFGALGRVGFFAKTLAPFASDALRKQAMECLDRVGLSHLAKQRADKISGGQKQRVAIARMLMQEPKVVLADEPIASLDPKAGLEVMDLLWEIVRERNLTVICVLHQMDVALKYGERIIGLKNGDVVIDQKNSQLAACDLDWLYETTAEQDEGGSENGDQ